MTTPTNDPEAMAEMAEKLGLNPAIYMSKRDLFAALALSGLLASDTGVSNRKSHYVKSAVSYADQLIEELNA